ncbi:MAG: tetratricopeptide repeat protein, partial [Pseudomonadota bacterium]
LKNEPQLAMAHACRGLFSLLLGRKELVGVAGDALAAARAALTAAGPDPRAGAYTAALETYLAGRNLAAADIIDRYLASYPRDALATKLSHSIRFIMGDAPGMRASLEAGLDAACSVEATRGYINGCYAFALEETGDHGLAERTGVLAVTQTPNDAWGLHAVAHVYDMTARADAGAEWLENRERSWEHCNNFSYHVFWHLALFYLDTGDFDAVLRMYDEDIRLDKSDDYRDISNAASILTRLELEGVDVGSRWDELADISQERTDDGCVVFADLHYMLALLGGDRDAATHQLLNRMAQTAVAGTTQMDAVCRHPGLTSARGLAAFREGHYRVAFKHLNAAHDGMQQVGGSHAQRDVFQRVTVEAAIRSGAYSDARAFLRARAAHRGGVDAYTERRLAVIDELLSAPVFVNAY